MVAAEGQNPQKGKTAAGVNGMNDYEYRFK
jgi:hypothetical protein